MENFSDLWCFRLGALSRKIYRYYNVAFSNYGITLPQSFVLFDLLTNDGSNIKDIAMRVQLDPPAVTNFVDRLIKEGLLIRQEDPSDRRSVKVFLTDEGRHRAEQLIPIAREFNERMRGAIETNDLPSFERSLTSLESLL